MWGMLATAALLLGANCGSERSVDGPEGGARVGYETILDETYSGLDEPLSEVVRDEGRWRELWDRIHSRVSPRPPLRAVDFSEHMLIAVATGARRSGGFSISVQGVTVYENDLEVEVRETCPAPGAMVTLALTQPVVVVRLERRPQTPRFRHTKAPSCD